MESSAESMRARQYVFDPFKDLIDRKEPKILLIGKMQSGKTTLITKLCDPLDPDY